MQCSHGRGRILLWLLVMGVAACLPTTSWAQGAPPADSEAPTSWSSAVAGVGAVVGSIVYAPFKALVMCPVSAVASGATYAVTGGATDTPRFLLRVGCSGTYVIAPAMVQGQEAFRAYDAR